MRVVIQRVQNANVKIAGKETGRIDEGLLVLVGFTHEDELSDLEWVANKIVNLRIFNDEEGKMNRSVLDIEGDILSVSQFTLFAATKKGNRPSFIQSAKPDIAEQFYHDFNLLLEKHISKPVQAGVFGAHMEVSLMNDGPVTISIDSKNRE